MKLTLSRHCVAFRPLRTILLACGAALSLAVAGCSGDGEGDAAAAPRLNGSAPTAKLAATDFQAGTTDLGMPAFSTPTSTNTALPPPPAAAPTTGPVRIGNMTTVTAVQATEGMDGVAVLAGEPVGTINDAARPTGGTVLVDSLVGQINGKPIYATKFLSEIDRRLIAEAEKVKDAQNGKDRWLRVARDIIAGQLNRQVQDDLLLAEARAALTTEERQGLLFFVNRLRENIASGYKGSEILADEELRKEGLSLEGKVEKEKQDVLVRTLVQRYIGPRVNPTFRDVQRVYDRNYAKYNPPAVAKFRMIWVENDGAHDAEISQIITALAARESFKDTASRPINKFSAKDGGQIPDKILIESYDKMRLFEDPLLNDAARKLTAGSTTGPFDYRQLKAWLHLESITQEAGRPLEDVQIEIMTELRSEKFNSEANRFFQRLRDRASVSDEFEMTVKLLSVAADRYFIASQLNRTPAKPEATRPEPARPEPTRPEPTKPEPTKPDATKPDATKPEPPKAGQVK